MKHKGFGVEDSPFMILAAVAVMLLVVWIGINIMASFVEGNEKQAATDASIEIYKRARLVSLGYDGSSERVSVSIPGGYAVSVDSSIVALKGVENGTRENTTQLTEPMSVQGIDIMGEESNLISAGEHDVLLTYSAKDGTVFVSWD